jgi:hypothetical protein
LLTQPLVRGRFSDNDMLVSPAHAHTIHFCFDDARQWRRRRASSSSSASVSKSSEATATAVDMQRAAARLQRVLRVRSVWTRAATIVVVDDDDVADVAVINVA